MMQSVPKSPYQETKGLIYFPRLLDKVRLFAANALRKDLHDNLGAGFDGRCCDFLRVDYEKLKHRILEGGSDDEILEWCFANGRELNEGDILIWNQFITKRGMADTATALLERRKRDAGLQDRKDILTMMEFIEIDEGRKS